MLRSFFRSSPDSIAKDDLPVALAILIIMIRKFSFQNISKNVQLAQSFFSLKNCIRCVLNVHFFHNYNEKPFSFNMLFPVLVDFHYCLFVTLCYVFTIW